MMRYLTMMSVVLFIAVNSIIAAAAQTNSETVSNSAAVESTEEVNDEAEQVTLPEQGTTEYWVIRSQAMTELIPFLTKKRTELKKMHKLLADYLLSIDKADAFADLKMPVKFDGKVYAEVLRIDKAFKEANIEIPKARPSWDEVVEIAMEYEVYEGYWPTDVEEGEDAAMYIEICKKKEEYGQKVRKDVKSILDQAANMWRYLDSIGELGNFKAHAADLVLQQKAAKAQEKAMYQEINQEAVIQRAADREQRQFEDREARASFNSSRRSRVYESREAQLQYRQSRLDERYVNSRAYYY